MFPHTHIYATKKIIGNPDSLLVYGSVLPDIAITRILDWDTVSKKAEGFRTWLNEKDKKCADLGLGMMLHEFPCGIDRFTHTSFDGGPGYAFKNSKEIIEDVSICCGINSDKARVIAHNFIETGVELLVIKENPNIPELLKNMIDDIDMARVAKYFAGFYGLSDKEVSGAIESYNKFLTREDYGSVEGSVKIWENMIGRLFGTKIDADKTKKVIERSVEIIKPTYEDFLFRAVESCKRDVEKYL